MSEQYVAAIDQGTTSTRCMIFNRDGRVVNVDQKEHEQIFPRAGWVEHDATEIWNNTREVTAGALAKAASGALDAVPYVEVVNIARALDELAELGFWRVALAGDGAQSLKEAVSRADVAIVLGSEGSGLRRLVRERCDISAVIPIDPEMESLNVSNAAAIALYEVRRG